MIVNANVLAVLEAATKGRCDIPDEALAAHRALGRFREARRSASVGTATATRAVEVPVDAVLEALAQGTKLDERYWTELYEKLQESEKAAPSRNCSTWPKSTPSARLSRWCSRNSTRSSGA